jgi:hypothetical protein
LVPEYVPRIDVESVRVAETMSGHLPEILGVNPRRTLDWLAVPDNVPPLFFAESAKAANHVPSNCT